MREIKFRAWDNDLEQMIYQGDDEYEFRLNENGIELIDRTFAREGRIYNNINCELMQYTGLKDKNGKEIYEGDICRWGDLETFNGEIIEDTFVVIWDDEKLAWYTQNLYSNFGYDLYEYTDDRDLEVIGNIYENADMLEIEEDSCI